MWVLNLEQHWQNVEIHIVSQLTSHGFSASWYRGPFISDRENCAWQLVNSALGNVGPHATSQELGSSCWGSSCCPGDLCTQQSLSCESDCHSVLQHVGRISGSPSAVAGCCVLTSNYGSIYPLWHHTALVREATVMNVSVWLDPAHRHTPFIKWIPLFSRSVSMPFLLKWPVFVDQAWVIATGWWAMSDSLIGQNIT